MLCISCKTQSRRSAVSHGKCINIQLPDLSTETVRKIHYFSLQQERRIRTAITRFTRGCWAIDLGIKGLVKKIRTTIEISETRAMSRGSRKWIIAATELEGITRGGGDIGGGTGKMLARKTVRK